MIETAPLPTAASNESSNSNRAFVCIDQDDFHEESMEVLKSPSCSDIQILTYGTVSSNT